MGIGAAIKEGNNMYRIQNIEASLRNFSGKHNMLVDNVMDLSGKHVQLPVDVLVLKDLVRLLNHKNYHKIITLMITFGGPIEGNGAGCEGYYKEIEEELCQKCLAERIWQISTRIWKRRLKRKDARW